MRYPPGFWKDLQHVRDRYGDKEYTRRDILPEVSRLLSDHGASHDALLSEAAGAALDKVESAEDKADLNSPTLFPDAAHVALGEGKRIKRGAMTQRHLLARKGVIDANKIAQDQSWARETGWLNDRIEALASHPPTTTVGDIFGVVADAAA